MALKLYLEGMGFRAIGRVLDVNFVTVYYWIKKWGESVFLPLSKEPIEIMELDEIHTYISNKKNYCWVWIAVDRFGKRYIDFICGKRSTKTFKELWDRLKENNINGFCSDYWKSYSELIPPEKHIESKA